MRKPRTPRYTQWAAVTTRSPPGSGPPRPNSGGPRPRPPRARTAPRSPAPRRRAARPAGRRAASRPTASARRPGAARARRGRARRGRARYGGIRSRIPPYRNLRRSLLRSSLPRRAVQHGRRRAVGRLGVLYVAPLRGVPVRRMRDDAAQLPQEPGAPGEHHAAHADEQADPYGPPANPGEHVALPLWNPDRLPVLRTAPRREFRLRDVSVLTAGTPALPGHPPSFRMSRNSPTLLPSWGEAHRRGRQEPKAWDCATGWRGR